LVLTAHLLGPSAGFFPAAFLKSVRRAALDGLVAQHPDFHAATLGR
jgi:hypothetical protein